MRIIARRGVPAAVALAVFAAAGRAGDWPQILGPARDGHSPERGLRTDWPAGGPPRAWETEVGAGFSGPAVAGGKLVLFHRLGNDEVVACLDAATGKELWRSAYRTGYRDDFGFDEGPRATPLIAGGRVFTLGADGELAAHEMASGKRLWRRNIREDYNAPKGYFGVACSPLLAGGRLLVNVGAPGAGIVAFDPATGKELWRATDDPAGYSSPAAATIRGRPHAVFLTRTGLVSLDPADGKVYFTKRWRARLAASVNAATPLVRDDRIFLSASYQTGAVLLEVGDGNRLKEVWSGDEMLSNHYNTSLLCGDFLYGSHGRQEAGAELRCVEWATGKVRWTEEGFGCAWLIGVGDDVLAVTEGGDLVAFAASPESYREKARCRILSRPTRAPVALANGRLYARDEKKLVCVDLRKE